MTYEQAYFVTDTVFQALGRKPSLIEFLNFYERMLELDAYGTPQPNPESRETT